ncbi:MULTISPECIES: hypothetical protein [unclassified Lysinibacillus]|uniref:hypothetical protein n=1 Tax=unclassified Lysinibacillus TaxID=2636778 RepID=UPI002554B17A|nr:MULTISPECIES: hypothetical protein [unclassified Lysinibacillus]MDM5249517.1 hypothetical protein [Lysinibacillus sp. G4S2]
MRVWFLFSGCLTPTEIEELSLRTPRPVVISLYRKRNANVASATTNVFCAKAKRQQQMFSVAKAKRQLQLHQGEIDFELLLKND